jgi:hypothetical protein
MASIFRTCHVHIIMSIYKKLDTFRFNYYLTLELYWVGGRAIAQAVSRRLPTAAVRGSKPDLGMWDFVMDKSGVEAGFLRELRFPLPIYIPSALHNHLHYHPRLAQ